MLLANNARIVRHQRRVLGKTPDYALRAQPAHGKLTAGSYRRFLSF